MILVLAFRSRLSVMLHRRYSMGSPSAQVSSAQNGSGGPEKADSCVVLQVSRKFGA
jgi:hypothetical protein